MMAQNAIEQVRETNRHPAKSRPPRRMRHRAGRAKILAVAVHNHYKRVFYADASRATTVWSSKRATSCLSASGSGKTLLAKTLAASCVPFAIETPR